MPVDFRFRQFRVNPSTFFKYVIVPQFGDTIDLGNVPQPSTEDGDWQIMDNVKWRVPIMEINGNANIIKRRDATCKLVYETLGRLGLRYIYAEEMYAAIEDCVKEFYQGCFIDFDKGNYDEIFQNLMPLMKLAVGTDIYSNKYFGDLEREADPTGTWSWNKFDGVFTHLARHIAAGTLPEAQTFEISPTDPENITREEVHDYLQQAYAAQPATLKSIPSTNKVFYVSETIWELYWDWLVYAGQSTIAERQLAAGPIRYKGIEIRPKVWDSILSALNGGTPAHIICLTIRANWLYLTDSRYGGGPGENEAIRVWYSMDDDVWRRQIHFKSGTEWINPTYVVFGMTTIT